MNQEEFTNEIDKFLNKLIKKGMIVTGCTEEQISMLEQNLGTLPSFYKVFLTRMGGGAGDFKTGTSLFYDELQEINEETRLLMMNNNISPPSMLVFLMHQGYTSLLFLDVISSNPTIYCYTEGESIVDINMTFSQFIQAEINNYLA
jgi:hypothetical protein